MDWISVVVALLVGFALGLAVAFFFRLFQGRTAQTLAVELARQHDAQRQVEMDAILEHLRLNFGDLSFHALERANAQFLQLARAQLDLQTEAGVRHLDAKKGLIDQQLQQMNDQLQQVTGLVHDLERDRREKFGELTSQLKTASEQTLVLTQTTSLLQQALANTRVRGQWGERMAEDVLRLAGFQEHINYQKQQVIAGQGTRPDFTFLLPRGLKLNMDVKFPLDNYLRFLEADSTAERERCLGAFLKDVKVKISDVVNREYINPTQNTVDYVLLFIPNEQIYTFLHEQDHTLLDLGLEKKVILCSPLTLFAILAIIRQAVDNFILEQASNEILSLLATFQKQWGEFVKKMEGLGKRLEAAQQDFNALVTTRRRALDRPLERLEAIRERRGLPVDAARLDEGADALE